MTATESDVTLKAQPYWDATHSLNKAFDMCYRLKLKSSPRTKTQKGYGRNQKLNLRHKKRETLTDKCKF